MHIDIYIYRVRNYVNILWRCGQITSVYKLYGQYSKECYNV